MTTDYDGGCPGRYVLEVPVHWGTLKLCQGGGKMWAEYSGRVSQNMAAELARDMTDPGYTVNGMTVAAFVRSWGNTG